MDEVRLQSSTVPQYVFPNEGWLAAVIWRLTVCVAEKQPLEEPLEAPLASVRAFRGGRWEVGGGCRTGRGGEDPGRAHAMAVGRGVSSHLRIDLADHLNRGTQHHTPLTIGPSFLFSFSLLLHFSLAFHLFSTF